MSKTQAKSTIHTTAEPPAATVHTPRGHPGNAWMQEQLAQDDAAEDGGLLDEVEAWTPPPPPADPAKLVPYLRWVEAEAEAKARLQEAAPTTDSDDDAYDHLRQIGADAARDRMLLENPTTAPADLNAILARRGVALPSIGGPSTASAWGFGEDGWTFTSTASASGRDGASAVALDARRSVSATPSSTGRPSSGSGAGRSRAATPRRWTATHAMDGLGLALASVAVLRAVRWLERRVPGLRSTPAAADHVPGPPETP